MGKKTWNDYGVYAGISRHAAPFVPTSSGTHTRKSVPVWLYDIVI